jgi:ABC-2 type transport system permease protein
VVRVLIELRRAIARHQLAAVPPAALVTSLVLAVLSAAGTVLLGWAHYPHAGTTTDVLALTSALWIGGRLAQCALSGEPLLRPELFALLPLPRRRLARALLLVGLLDPANVLLAAALTATVHAGVRDGTAATVVAVAAGGLTVLLTSVLATVVAGLLGPGSRRGHDAGTVVAAVLISGLAVAGTLLPTLLAALRDRRAGGLSAVLRALPPGWGPRAIAAAGHGEFAGTLVPLAALAALSAGVAAAWPAVLGRRMLGRRPDRRAVAHTAPVRTALVRTPTGAVVAKELRLWLRDPIRLTCLIIALVVGPATCVLPRVTAGTDLLLPFGGAMTVVIAGACACNLYGNDGSSVWLTVLAPGSARADVYGRQLAWLLVVAPYALASTLVLTAAARSAPDWPAAIGLLAALLGGGAGVAAYGSLIAVQPLDEAGNPTPAWSLKVHVALVAVAATAAPPLVVVLAGGGWAAVAVGVVSGTVLAAGLGRLAVARLARRQVALIAAATGATPA